MRSRILLIFLVLLAAAGYAVADRETTVYWTISEEAKGFDRDLQVLERKMKGKVSARDAESAKAKYAECKLSWDADRKKLKELKVAKYPDMLKLTQTLVDQQDLWASNAVFAIDMENRGNDYYKGVSNGYDPDRGQAMASAAREKAVEAHQAYDQARKELGVKLEEAMKK